MERIIGYDKKELTVLFQPSLIDTFFGDTTRTIIYVNVGTYYLSTAIKWVDKSTGEDRRCEQFDNYILAQEICNKN